jgi:fructoselysine-6-P-deglycase FrlB-like protein
MVNLDGCGGSLSVCHYLCRVAKKVTKISGYLVV